MQNLIELVRALWGDEAAEDYARKVDPDSREIEDKYPSDDNKCPEAVS